MMTLDIATPSIMEDLGIDPDGDCADEEGQPCGTETL